ncbi:type II toxin-antitoxin system prevent-host-death family antitoxin [Candidatus Saccharibacteria bacterium]|nr:type II toxin-antitoxin system prevent-host-death family antitoxin [Candidatus Saccharibacteria bacterium]
MGATTIRPSADLRNNYNEISRICNEHNEPVFITKNGHGDLAVMSIDLYNRLAGRHDLYRLIDEGLSDLENGRSQPFDEVVGDLRQRIKNNDL